MVVYLDTQRSIPVPIALPVLWELMMYQDTLYRCTFTWDLMVYLEPFIARLCTCAGGCPSWRSSLSRGCSGGPDDRKRWIKVNPAFLSCQNLFLHLQNLVGEEESKVSGKYAVLHVSQNLSGRQHVTDNDNDLWPLTTIRIIGMTINTNWSGWEGRI